MSTESLWQTFEIPTNFSSLSGDIDVDVAIIGGGITGVTCAQFLKDEGLRVAVFESHRVGASNTGRSTGNLYDVIGGELIRIREKYSAEVVRNLLQSRKEGVDHVERNIHRFGIDCDFRRAPWFYYAATEERVQNVRDHFRICEEAGLPVSKANVDHQSLKSIEGHRVENQAQFNPIRYTQGLALAINDETCRIFEDTVVTDVDERDGKYFLRTENGIITARHVIHASHSPKGIMIYHTLMEAYREYGVAARIEDPQHPEGVHFGQFGPEEHYSTRQYERDGQNYVVVVGAPHKVGHGNTIQEMRKLEAFALKHFKVTEFTHRWGGQHYRPADELPYIGRKAMSDQVYVATGFATHGLVYGTVAAKIITDQIMKRKNQYEELYSSTRFTPMKSAKNFVRENAAVFRDLVRDHLRRDHSPLADVAPGEGKVLDHEGHKLAVYRDEVQGLQVCSAVCTHLGCIVHWNNDERSWDCPCHGSRFSTDGEVLEGPALHALAKANLVDDEKPLRNPIPTIRDNLGTGLST